MCARLVWPVIVTVVCPSIGYAKVVPEWPYVRGIGGGVKIAMAFCLPSLHVLVIAESVVPARLRVVE